MGSIAKTLLPIAGTVIGSYFGMPGIGGALGTALGGAAGGAVGTALAGRSEAPSVPQPSVQPTSVMPLPDSEAVAAEKRRSISSQVSRRGRASTILTQGGLDQGTQLGA